MPKISCERIDPRFDGGPGLWRAAILYDSDEELEVYGESLSRAVDKLASMIKGREQQEMRERAMGWKGDE